MTDRLFDLTFLLAVPFWTLMIFAPSWRWTARIMASPLIVLPPVVVYAVLMADDLSALWTTMSRPDLGTLIAFLSTPDGAAAVWAQLIAWDLLVGRWMYHQSRALSIHPLAMAPVYVLTILLSPFGLLTFLGVRAIARLRCDARDRGTAVVTGQ